MKHLKAFLLMVALTSLALFYINCGNRISIISGSLSSNSVAAYNQVRFAQAYCQIQGQFDDTCLRGALANLPAGKLNVIMPPGIFYFKSEVKGNFSNVTISGQGPTTVIAMDSAAIECDNCDSFTIQNLAFTTVTVPSVVTPAQLPTADPNAMIVIDRYGLGKGYIPGPQDYDIIPTSVCTQCLCTQHCLSSAQQEEVFSTGINFISSSNIVVTGLSGNFYYLYFYSSNNVQVMNNQIYGAKAGGGIIFWKASANSLTNSNLTISQNNVSYTTHSGIVTAGTNAATVADNTVTYTGESGIKISGQGPGYESSNITVTGNTVEYNQYDGLDLSEDYPHTGTFIANSSATQNTSQFNRHTGLFIDGQNWNLSGNTFNSNGYSGMKMDLNNSTVSGNTVTNNNTQNFATGECQILSGAIVAPNNVSISSNIISDTAGYPGYCIYLSAGTGDTASYNSCATNTAETYYNSKSATLLKGNTPP